MPVGYKNHCGDSVRCDVCPINLLEYEDQARATELIELAVNEPRYEHMRHAKVGEIRGMARQTIERSQNFLDKQFLGIVAGALVLTATGECTSLYEGEE